MNTKILSTALCASALSLAFTLTATSSADARVSVTVGVPVPAVVAPGGVAILRHPLTYEQVMRMDRRSAQIAYDRRMDLRHHGRLGWRERRQVDREIGWLSERLNSRPGHGHRR